MFNQTWHQLINFNSYTSNFKNIFFNNMMLQNNLIYTIFNCKSFHFEIFNILSYVLPNNL